MQTRTFCLLVTVGLAFGGTAFARSEAVANPGDALVITREGTDLGIARAEPMEGIEVNAPALRDGTLVAVNGTISGREGSNLLIASTRNGQVLANIRATGSPEFLFYGRPIAASVALGDQVTVFGSLKKEGSGLTVEADAVYDGASGTLYFPREADQLAASPFYNPSRFSLSGHALNTRYRVL